MQGSVVNAIVGDTNSYLYVADTGNDMIRRITRSGDVTTFASGLSDPQAVWLNSNGIVYFTDSSGIYSQLPSSSTKTTISSNIPGDPVGLTGDLAGNLYISVDSYYFIYQVTSGDVTVYAGTGTSGDSDDGEDATSASFGTVYGLYMSAEGILFFGDYTNNRIRMLS